MIVSFGSAPGVPNWGGLLKKLRKGWESEERATTSCTSATLKELVRGNKMTGNVEDEVSKRSKRLEDVCSKYSKVLYRRLDGRDCIFSVAEHATSFSVLPSSRFIRRVFTIEECKLDATI